MALSFYSCSTTSSKFMVIFESTPRGPLPEVYAPPRICAPTPLSGPVFWLSLDYLWWCCMVPMMLSWNSWEFSPWALSSTMLSWASLAAAASYDWLMFCFNCQMRKCNLPCWDTIECQLRFGRSLDWCLSIHSCSTPIWPYLCSGNFCRYRTHHNHQCLIRFHSYWPLPHKKNFGKQFVF
jgi:hypothetical protein